MKEARAFEDMTSDEDKSKLPLQIANRKYTFTAKITPNAQREEGECMLPVRRIEQILLVLL